MNFFEITLHIKLLKILLKIEFFNYIYYISISDDQISIKRDKIF